MIKGILNHIKANDISYVLMHSVEKIQNTSSDIDILISKDGFDRVSKTVNEFVDQNNGKVISQYNTIGGNLIMNIIFAGELISTYRLDFYSKPYFTVYKTYPYAFYSFDESLFFENIIVVDDVLMPAYEVQYVHYLCRKLLKNDINETNLNHLKCLYANCDKTLLVKLLNDFFGDIDLDILNVNSNDKFYDELRARLFEFLIKSRRYKKLYFINRIQNKIKTLSSSKGLHIAIIGPDGTGKTTLIDKVVDQFSNVFTKVNYIHLRPTLVPASRNVQNRLNKAKSSIPKPHENKEYNFFLSWAKSVVMLIDYIVGFWIKIAPKKASNELVISDRYFYDMFVDPKRFRMYSVSIFLKKIMFFLVPRPDITLLLIASPETVYSRKKDLELEEIKRQNYVFLEIERTFKEVCRISSEQSPINVYNDAVKAIISKTV